MTRLRDRLPLPWMPRPSVLLAAVAATVVGTALRDPGTGLLCAAAVLVLARDDGIPAAAPPGWPAAAADPDGQVGHPLVTDLLTDLERADKDATVLGRLARRTGQALALPAPPAARRVADLEGVLGRATGGAGS